MTTDFFSRATGFLRRRDVLFWLISIAGLTTMIWTFANNIATSLPGAAGLLARYAGDAAAVTLPFWLIPGRRRNWFLILCVWLFAFWAVTNLCYFRFWSDIISPAAVTMTGNIGSDLLGWGATLLKVSDIIFIIIPICITSATFMPAFRKAPSPCSGIRVSMSVICMLMFLLSQTLYIRSSAINLRHTEAPLKSIVRNHFTHEFSRQSTMFLAHGLPVYAADYTAGIWRVTNISRNLSTEEKTTIRNFLDCYARPASCRKTTDRNIVLIIVESLNSDVLGLSVNGFEITPTLNALARMKGTVTFPSVVSQVKAGGSSDGHILLMSGLLPMKEGATSLIFGSTLPFPSLSRALPAHSKKMILADNGVIWNENLTFRSLGMGTPLNSDNFDIRLAGSGRDAAMFRTASAVADTIGRPFFLGLMTMSMHIPFEEPAAIMPAALKNSSLSENEKKYLNVTSYFDRCLGEFLATLPPDTFVAIVSDHSQDITSPVDVDMQPTPGMALFMAVNSRHTGIINRIIGQVNIYPALLEILDIGIPGYGGLAPSALSPRVNGSIDAYGNSYGPITTQAADSLREAFRISDLIIRANGL